MFKVVFGVAKSKRNEKMLLLLKEILGHVNHVFNKISFFKHKSLFKIFIFAMFFFVDDFIDLKIRRWKVEARHYTLKNHRKSEHFK